MLPSAPPWDAMRQLWMGFAGLALRLHTLQVALGMPPAPVATIAARDDDWLRAYA